MRTIDRLTTANIVEIILVVLVLSMLLTVSIPRFLNSQVRVDVAKAHRGLRALGDALLLYRVDNRTYFGMTSSNPYEELRLLTTPVAYIESMPTDPFRHSDSVYKGRTSNYDYSSYGRISWVLASLGPDTDEDASGLCFQPGPPERLYGACYHTSNGLTSSGDLYRVSWLAPSKPRHP